MGGFITEYEEKLGRTIAGVITGGDVPAGTLVTEQYLLDLEREAFLRLCGERKTARADPAHAEEGQAAAELREPCPATRRDPCHPEENR